MRLKTIISFLLLISSFSVAFAARRYTYTLVIDAGHGGKDAGACAFGAREKDINLNVALAFGRYVERNCPDVKVIYTRKTDVFIPLHQRASIANRNKADVFISIHTNAVASKRPISGMETYTMGIRRSNEKLSAAMRENEVISYEDDYKQRYAGYDPRSPESMMVFQIMNEHNMAKSVELASLIQRYTCSTAKRPNKGVRQDAFLVLRETSMPACLVELGYITTRSEKNYLVNRKNVDLMGQGIYQAFVAFKNIQQGKAAPEAKFEVPVKTIKTRQTTSVVEKNPVVKLEKEDVVPSVAQPVALQRNQVVNAKQAPVVKQTQAVQQTQVIQQDQVVQQTAVPLQEASVQQETPIAQSTETQQTISADVETAAQTEENKEVPPTEAAQPVGTVVTQSAPIFKVQFLASSTTIKEGDRRLKGLKDVNAYKEGSMWKYTIGASENYNEIYRLRRSILKKFPQAFIIAFRNGEKIDAANAYQEYKQNRK